MEEFFALLRRLPAVLLALFGAVSPLLSRVSAPPPSSAAGGPSSDPHAPGLRWSRAASSSAPWIPRDLAFAGDGELLWTAPAGGTPSLALYSTAEVHDPDFPRCEDHGPTGAIGAIHVAAGADARALFALAQFPAPQAPFRRSVVTRHDAVAAAAGTGFLPLWSTELGLQGNGPSFLAVPTTGDVIVAACFDAGRQEVRVERLDPAGGASVAAVTLPALALRNLAIAEDGRRAVVLVGPEAFVLDENLAVLHVVSLPGAGAAVALDAPGARIVLGNGDEVLLVEESVGTWTSRPVAAGGPGETVVSAVLSADGSVLAVTWWNAGNGADVRCQILDPAKGVGLGSWTQTGAVGSLQNYPQSLAITPGGERVAVGLWGAGDARPEVVLLEVGTGAPLLEVDLPGSVQALALDPSGTRIAVGMKDTHANQFSTTGAVRLYDTGERDLQLVAGPRVGGRLELVLAPPPAAAAVFGVGFPLAAPVSVPALGGELWLDPGRPLSLLSATPDAQGRAWFATDVPADPSLIGLSLVVQAASLRQGGGLDLAETVVWPPLF